MDCRIALIGRTVDRASVNGISVASDFCQFGRLSIGQPAAGRGNKNLCQSISLSIGKLVKPRT